MNWEMAVAKATANNRDSKVEKVSYHFGSKELAWSLMFGDDDDNAAEVEARRRERVERQNTAARREAENQIATARNKGKTTLNMQTKPTVGEEVKVGNVIYRITTEPKIYTHVPPPDYPEAESWTAWQCEGEFIRGDLSDIIANETAEARERLN